jgi:putative ABC transport system permease protein
MVSIPVRPIVSSLVRHKAGVFILACQVALTLAIVANVLFIITQRVALILQPSGIDEANIIIVDNHWVGPLTLEEAHVRTDADLAALRSLPGVVDAYADYSYPIAGPWANLTGLSLERGQKSPTSLAEPYFADEHALATYGLRLIKGRNFQTGEVILGSTDADPQVGSIIITEDLSKKLFPSGDALGKTVFMSNHPRTIVGIIADVKVPEKKAPSNLVYKAVFMPVRLSDVAGDPYIVRTQPGAAGNIRKSITDALYNASRLRILDRQEGVQHFRTLRTKAFANDRGLVILLTVASIILLLATAGGIIGITTLWVEGRRRALGMRRALGARRRDILAYILAENFFIVLLGILSGSIIALTANISLMHYLALKSLPPTYITLTSLFVLVLGQCAALPPARLAARVPPAEAMRIVPI